MNVLVTGGAGYIGSHTCKALAEAGHRPVVLDNLAVGKPWAVKWGPLVAGDINDSKLVGGAIADHKIEAIMHLAAAKAVAESVEDPRKYYEGNVLGTLSLFNSALEAGVNTIVYSSSCATYGIPAKIPVREDAPQLPINPYGESKLIGEWMLRAYGNAYGIRWTALRYFNAAGADPGGEIGESNNPESTLIPVLVRATLGQRGPAPLFGDDYATADGTAIRDYVHVSDLARAHVMALESLLAGNASRAFNLGTGQGYSVREIVDALETISGCKVPVEIKPRRSGDPPEVIADASLAQRELGWQPQMSDLHTIMNTAWQWHSRYELEMLDSR